MALLCSEVKVAVCRPVKQQTQSNDLPTTTYLNQQTAAQMKLQPLASVPAL